VGGVFFGFFFWFWGGVFGDLSVYLQNQQDGSGGSFPLIPVFPNEDPYGVRKKLNVVCPLCGIDGYDISIPPPQ